MEKAVKIKLINSLKRLIKKINSGACDNLTSDQYDKFITALTLLLEVEIDLEQDKK